MRNQLAVVHPGDAQNLLGAEGEQIDLDTDGLAPPTLSSPTHSSFTHPLFLHPPFLVSFPCLSRWRPETSFLSSDQSLNRFHQHPSRHRLQARQYEGMSRCPVANSVRHTVARVHGLDFEGWLRVSWD
ncbi:hypothetical protein C0Q70_13359 [Pomacea canaliculata]|uniref:Uncharacterized protein n=1 Tax=Pomacea canaliculata TaxID=400727 RepID=A0A2T7NX08_POMCA|nr:hypothetical protein C0Q70_13359 [Pomacea canaliculata]